MKTKTPTTNAPRQSTQSGDFALRTYGNFQSVEAIKVGITLSISAVRCMLLLGSWLDRELAMSRGYLVKVKDISIHVRDHCHEAAPWLPRGRHREVYSQTSQTRVLSPKVGDF